MQWLAALRNTPYTHKHIRSISILSCPAARRRCGVWAARKGGAGTRMRESTPDDGWTRCGVDRLSVLTRAQPVACFSLVCNVMYRNGWLDSCGRLAYDVSICRLAPRACPPLPWLPVCPVSSHHNRPAAPCPLLTASSWLFRAPGFALYPLWPTPCGVSG